MAKRKKKSEPRESFARPAPGGVREIFPGEPLYDDSPKRPLSRKNVFEETDEEKRKKQRESAP